MNIVEAYLKFKGSLIIAVSGLSGCGKTELAKDIARDLKMKIIDVKKYYKDDYDKHVEVNEMKVVDWDDIGAIDWDKLNDEIKDETNIVIVGAAFPEDTLKIIPDIHFHIKISKKNLIERRHEYIDKHRENVPVLYELKDTDTEMAIFNKLSLTHYYEYLEKSKVSKFLNANELDQDKIYDEAFDYIMNHITKYLDSIKKPKEKSNDYIKKQSDKPKNKIQDIEFISINAEYDGVSII